MFQKVFIGTLRKKRLRTAKKLCIQPTVHKTTESGISRLKESVLLLITGLSGAGKSTVLDTLEDLGYEVVDNLPLRLLRTLIEESGQTTPLAIGIDSRSAGFSSDFLLKEIVRLRNSGKIKVILIFLTCDSNILRLRFTETRRRHPLAIDRPVTDGIIHERQLMMPLLERSDHVFDTSSLAVSDLRLAVDGHFALTDGPPLTISITSFAFRHGLPREADLVFDVRFLVNPHYVDHLRNKTGLDEEVIRHIQEDPDYKDFFARACAFVLPLLPRYTTEGKRYLTIAIGCTGGRHRSVAVSEELATLIARAGYPVKVRHRDIDQIGLR